MPLKAALAVAAAVAMLAAAETASGAARVARLRAITPVAAYGGHVAWSRYDPSHRTFRLVIRSGSRTWTPRVRPRPVPFDVDLGPHGDGRVDAVYSRCRTEPTRGTLSDGLPDYRGSGGCRLYRLDVRSGREEALPAGGGAPGNRYEPAIWGRRVAFVASRGARAPAVYVASRSRGARARRLAGGTPGRASGETAGPTGVDLDRRRVAYSWRHDDPCPEAPAGEFGEPDRTELWLDDLDSRKHVLVARGEPGGCAGGVAAELSSPALAAGHLAYLRRVTEGATDSELADQDLGTGETAVTALDPGVVCVARTREYVLLDRRTGYDSRTGRDASVVLRAAALAV